MQTQHQACEDGSDSDLRRGPWTAEEDVILTNYIAVHGEGRWNSLACSAGLKRTGKSCRLRWLNYLRPDVRRGNLTAEEQLLILELHSRWGNRWSKIAKYLPGRTDNEIKNYWRTRVQKHARNLQCDVNSKKFRDLIKYLWMPRLVERISAASTSTSTSTSINTNNNYVATEDNIGCDDYISILPQSQLKINSEDCTSSGGFSVSESIGTGPFSPPVTVQDNHGFDGWTTEANIADPNTCGGLPVQLGQFGSLDQDFMGFDQDFMGLDQDLGGVAVDNFWSMMDGELWSTL